MSSPSKKITSNIDEAFSDLEKRYAELQENYQKLSQEKKDQLKICQEKDARISLLEENMNTFQARRSFLEKDVADKNQKLEASSQAVERANDAAERRGQEAEVLRTELHHQADQLSSNQERLSAALKDLAEAQDRVAPLQYANEKFRKEKEALEKHSKWLSSELDARSEELLATKKKLTSENFELKSELETLRALHEKMTQEVDLLKGHIQKRDSKASESSARILELESQAAQSRERFDLELAAQKKISSLHKQNTEEVLERVKELEKINDEQAKALAEAANKAREGLQKQKMQAEELLEKAHDDAKEKIDALAKELEKAQEAAKAAPTSLGAAGTGLTAMMQGGSALTAEGALSLTEMYDKVVRTEEELRGERTERRRLEMYINRILQEMEKKMPMLASRSKDYRRAQETHELMADRLNQALQEIDGLQADLIRMEEERNNLVIENKELKKSVSDLSRQVQLLLKAEMEASTGSKMPESSRAVVRIPTEADAAGSDQVISDYLVTFSSIQELQTRNQQLLQVIRRLSEEKEVSVAEELEKRASIDGRQLKQYLSELEAMREEREAQEEMVNAIIQQRDMYRTLLAQADAQYSSTPKKGKRSREGTPLRQSPELLMPALDPPPSMEAAALEKRVKQLEKEATQLQELLAKARDAERITADILAESRDNASKARAEAARQAAEAKFHQDRAEQLSTAAAEARAEIDRGSTARAELQALLVAHQRQATDREAEFTALEDENRKLSGAFRNAETEKELARSAEKRLSVEVSALRAEASRQAQLLEGIQRIEAGLTAKGGEQRAMLEAEVTRLQKALDDTRKEWRDKVTMAEYKSVKLQQEAKIASEKLEQISAQLASLKQEKAVLETKLHATQEAETAAQKHSSGLQLQLDKILVSGSAKETAAKEAVEQEMKLQNALSDLEATKTELQAVKKHSAQYQAIAASHEATLKELGESSEKRRAALAIELEDAQALNNRMTADAQQKQEKFLELMSEMEELRTALEKKEEAHTKAMAERAATIDALKADLAALKPREDAFIADKEAFKAQARQAQANYDRELQLHAEAAAKARDLEAKNQELKKEMAGVRNVLSDLKENQKAVESIHEEQLSVLQKDKDMLKDEKANLTAQNEVLYNQVEALSKKVEDAMAKRTEEALGAGLTEEGKQEAKTETAEELRRQLVELREVVRYLRREREMADARAELLELASARHEAAAKQTERELQTVRQTLQELEHSEASKTHSLEKDAETIALIEQQNLLRESNALLRAEHDKIQANAKQLQNDLKTAQEELGPLRQSQRVLMAEKKAVESDKVALEKECASWKSRLRALVSKYNQIDPVEHRKAVEGVAKLSKELATSEAGMEKLRKDLTAAKGTIMKMQKEAQASSTETKNLKAMMSLVERLKTQLANRNKDLIDKAAELGEKDKQLEEKNKEIESLLKQKEEAVQKAETAIAEKATNQGLLDKTAELGEKDKQLEALKQTNKEIEALMKDKKEAVQKAEIANKALKQKSEERIAALEKQLQEKNAELERTISRSDRMTQLLRTYKQKMQEQQQQPRKGAPDKAPSPAPAPVSAPSAPAAVPGGNTESLPAASSASQGVSGPPVVFDLTSTPTSPKAQQSAPDLEKEDQIRKLLVQKRKREAVQQDAAASQVAAPQTSKPRLNVDQSTSTSEEGKTTDAVSPAMVDVNATTEAPATQTQASVADPASTSVPETGSGLLGSTQEAQPKVTTASTEERAPISAAKSAESAEKPSIFGAASKPTTGLTFGSTSKPQIGLGTVGSGSSPKGAASGNMPTFGSQGMQQKLQTSPFGSGTGISPLAFGASSSPLGFGFAKSDPSAKAPTTFGQPATNKQPLFGSSSTFPVFGGTTSPATFGSASAKGATDDKAVAAPKLKLSFAGKDITPLKAVQEDDTEEGAQVKTNSLPGNLPTLKTPIGGPQSSPFLNLQPPSPGQKGITLQFGKKPALSLPVPGASKSSPAEGSPNFGAGSKPWPSPFAIPSPMGQTKSSSAAPAPASAAVIPLKQPNPTMTEAERIKLRERRFNSQDQTAPKLTDGTAKTKQLPETKDAEVEDGQLKEEGETEGSDAIPSKGEN